MRGPRIAAAALGVVAAVAALIGPAAAAERAPGPDPVRSQEYWLEDYGIRQAWQTTRGEGARIAIIDTGIGRAPEFAGVVGGTDVSGLGSPDGRTPVGGTDADHGSWVASLAASRGLPGDTGMIGVAPGAELLSVSVGLGQDAARPFATQVAEAVRWSVDYDGIADAILKGQWQVHQSCLPVGAPAALAELPYRLDLPRARQLVRASSLIAPKVRLGTPNGWPYLDIAKKVQDGLKEAGIDVELVAVDQRQSLADYRARGHDIVLARLAPDYPDPHSSAAFFAQNLDNGDETIGRSLAWRNRWLAPELTQAAQAALAARDRTARVNAFLAIQRRLQADSAYVFMFQQVAQTVSRAIVTGLEMGPAFDSVRFARAGK
jgi:ABC-type transport system substrate-binding protein